LRFHGCGHDGHITMLRGAAGARACVTANEQLQERHGQTLLGQKALGCARQTVYMAGTSEEMCPTAIAGVILRVAGTVKMPACITAWLALPISFPQLSPSNIAPVSPAMSSIISIRNLSKTYATGFEALKNVNLDIRPGEIFALLGPNGAGKTTLISIVCGIVNPSEGSVSVDGHDIIIDYRAARSMIGLVPQELTTDAFESVWDTVSFTRGLFGKPANPAHIEKVLKDLSLWNKKDDKIMTLSGGMKRRLLIAKALSHEPRILFLDEPTAGVDVELRREMWQTVRRLQQSGVTIILTTHYIEEAQEMADRVGVINNGELVLVEEKAELMRKLGKKQLIIDLQDKLDAIPASLSAYGLELTQGGTQLVYTYDTQSDRTGITGLLGDLRPAGVRFKDLNTKQSSLEQIFVELVKRAA
jgi:ABC-2 type transport system ATP-binding protein